LAPDEVTQPPKVVAALAKEKESSDSNPATSKPSPTSVSAPAAPELRTWRDRSGKFSVEAEFISREANKVRLRTKQGREITVEISRLSDDDRAVLEKQ
jgi:hypothetical protein